MLYKKTNKKKTNTSAEITIFSSKKFQIKKICYYNDDHNKKNILFFPSGMVRTTSRPVQEQHSQRHTPFCPLELRQVHIDRVVLSFFLLIPQPPLFAIYTAKEKRGGWL